MPLAGSKGDLIVICGWWVKWWYNEFRMHPVSRGWETWALDSEDPGQESFVPVGLDSICLESLCREIMTCNPEFILELSVCR